MKTYNGMPATEIMGVGWRKSSASNSQGACVELAKLGSDEFAVRNSRYPDGPALIYTHALRLKLKGVPVHSHAATGVS